MTPQVGCDYSITHPRAGHFTATVDAIRPQITDNGKFGTSTYTWVLLRIMEGTAFRLASREQIGPGQTIELLAETTEFNRPYR